MAKPTIGFPRSDPRFNLLGRIVAAAELRYRGLVHLVDLSSVSGSGLAYPHLAPNVVSDSGTLGR
jgi:hypothetical protein